MAQIMGSIVTFYGREINDPKSTHFLGEIFVVRLSATNRVVRPFPTSRFKLIQG